MNAPILSLALATYNRWHELEPTLRALLPQLADDVELVISDNASPDGTADLAERMCAGKSNARILRHSENVGAVSNFRDAAEASRGQYVMFLADDDIPSEHFVALAKNVLRKHPDRGLYHFVYDPSQKVESVIERGPGPDAITLIFAYSGMIPGLAFPREVFDGALWVKETEVYPQVLLAASLARDHGSVLTRAAEGLILGGQNDTAISRARSRPADFGIGERLTHLTTSVSKMPRKIRLSVLNYGTDELLTWGWIVFDELQGESPAAAQRYISALTALKSIYTHPNLLRSWTRHAIKNPSFFHQTGLSVCSAALRGFRTRDFWSRLFAG